jgi:hypothetical protein
MNGVMVALLDETRKCGITRIAVETRSKNL